MRRIWAALAKTSVPTAQRDINELVTLGVLRRGPGGSKNTTYELDLTAGLAIIERLDPANPSPYLTESLLRRRDHGTDSG